MKVVLASESQSRKRALDMLRLTYDVHPSTIDEGSIRDTDPAALTKNSPKPRLAKLPAPSTTLSWSQATPS
jgi:predicted house-cleaning NTP pyrophosphatase (Maf/HAM1 superfamily)